MRGCMLPPIPALELLVTLLRCAPTFTETRCPPTCEELGDAAQGIHIDMVTVDNATKILAEQMSA